jgi:hypothetical protein
MSSKEFQLLLLQPLPTCGDGRISKSQRSVEMEDFMKTLEPLTLKERDEIETKFDKALGTIQCFLDPTCKEIARGCPEDTQGLVGRARILYQDLFTDPSIYNQARRRIS